MIGAVVEFLVQAVLEGAIDGLFRRASTPRGRFCKRVAWSLLGCTLLTGLAAWGLANRAAAQEFLGISAIVLGAGAMGFGTAAFWLRIETP